MLPFSADVLASLLARYNSTLWPAPLVALVLLTAVLGLALQRAEAAGRIAALTLAAGWAWTGIAFHAATFASLNFAAPIYAVLFVVQAVLLVWTGAVRDAMPLARPQGPAEAAGLGLAVIALAGWPLLALGARQGLAAAEVAGVAPDPTALFTLGVLLLVRGRTPWHLAALPIAWSFAGGVTAWALGGGPATLQALAGLAAIPLIYLKNRRVRQGLPG